MLISTINLRPVNFRSKSSIISENIPPDKLYKRTDGLPEKILPSSILHIRIKNVSFGERYNRANSVTMFARPSLTPGIGIGSGICASTIKIVKAMAHKIAENAMRFVFDVDLNLFVSILFHLTYIILFICL